MFHVNQLVGRYRIKNSIGSGGFGTVFLAEDTWLDTLVALKVPHQQTASLELLLAEPRVLAALDHPGILRVMTVEKAESVFFLVTEYVKGESLGDRIDRQGSLKVQDFLDLMSQVLPAVRHAHERKVVHRDLRPANILLGEDGRVKVADFGISKRLSSSGHAITRIGSPPYMAPEQFAGRTVLQSDVYALGVIMYESLTATLPIAEVQAERVRARQLEGNLTPPHVRNPAVPEGLSQVVMKAMAPSLAERYPEVRALEEDLFARPLTSAAEGLREIRQRLGARPSVQTRNLCWNCHRPVAKRTNRCAHCQEGQ